MRSNKTSSFGTRGGEPCTDQSGSPGNGTDCERSDRFLSPGDSPAQPYVILLDPATGILKRLDLGSRGLSRSSRIGD